MNEILKIGQEISDFKVEKFFNLHLTITPKVIWLKTKMVVIVNDVNYK